MPKKALGNWGMTPTMSLKVGILSMIVALASGNSLGLNVPTCNTDDKEIWKPLPKGCTKIKALGGDDCALGYNMWWASAPKYTNDFKLYASTSPTGSKHQPPQKTYTAGGLVYIHIRATKQNLKYRGLLLYAQDGNKKKVGSWELPYEVTMLLNVMSMFESCLSRRNKCFIHHQANVREKL